ncbi:adenosylmethionine decarboxylase [Clostridium sp. 'deep sea']|uniref:adenosylmethionine decarboxylase n=1 Tax=Clostridium sp. 'deep sea' TaxID=2779445 RepID=UPI0018967DBD|nr:adenosylmethionine decarboxylase [Clostridium sp. 'deep sea']QOR35539.1 adenosylmethionine decarboxylase [Clostridium sp. 'deep sea']
MANKLKLHGFNNLTKTLSFNMYDICYAQTVEDRKAYIKYIDQQYNAERLTDILTEVSNIIGANILNIAKQNYTPQGASVTILVCEGKVESASLTKSIAAHLDKSHITVHTYPEYHPDEGVCTFRADIDVSTCGKISPLRALDFLVKSFAPDIMTLDYRVRGFTRDIAGNKLFIDHDINSIQDYLNKDILQKYDLIDVNEYKQNIFHTRCRLKEFDIDNYLFGISEQDLEYETKYEIINKLSREMNEIFYGRNLLRDY